MGAKYFNEKQIEKLLSSVKGDILETVILFAIFYGLRRSEILGLRWKSIDLENDLFSINHTVIRVSKVLYKNDLTKNQSSNADMPIPEIIKQNLLKIKEEQENYKALQPNDYVDEGYVFTQVNGKVFNPNYVTKRFSQLLAQNGLPHIRFHDLRHSSAGYLKHLGFDLKDTQTWLRHGDIGTTMNIYVNLDMDAKRDIAEYLNQRFKNFSI
jgi:integrase